MKKIGIYVIIFILVILFRDNICFFYGNVLGIFKLDNSYYDAIITLKDNKIDYLEKEYKELNEFSKDIEKISYSYKVSKIIYKESYNMNKYYIQYGKNDGVKVGNAIMNENGLIGKVVRVESNKSEFSSLKGIKDLSVKVNNSYGKLNYDYKNNYYVISDISNYDKVYINDEVYTSGYGSIRENIFVGKVIKIENDTISKRLIINNILDDNNLNYVLIVGEF